MISPMLIKEDLEQIRIVVGDSIKPLRDDVEMLKDGVKKINNKLDTLISTYDREVTGLLRRTKRLENKVELNSKVN